MVIRTANGFADESAASQIGAHVPTTSIENGQAPAVCAKGHQRAAKHVPGPRFFTQLAGSTEQVPRSRVSGETGRRWNGQVGRVEAGVGRMREAHSKRAPGGRFPFATV